MKTPVIEPAKFERFNKVDRLLGFVFKIGLPIGVLLLIIGEVTAPRNNSDKFAPIEAPVTTSIAELVMSLACIAMAAKFAIEAYAFARGSSQSIRSIIEGMLLNFVAIFTLVGAAVVLVVLALRDRLP